MGILEEAIAIKAGTLWLQLGISVPQVAEAGDQAGINVIMNRCLKIWFASAWVLKISKISCGISIKRLLARLGVTAHDMD
jgi:hypothetical protein